MRIISGKYRGKKLKEFDINTTRPTLDRVKESIFNLIQFDVANSVVLDLFSGTGALGIECVSRSAKQVFLVDENPKAIKLINENLKGIEGNFKVVQSEALQFLKTTQQKFDIVLLDPPFVSTLGEQAIDLIVKNNLLASGGIIIFETSAESNINFDESIFNVSRKKYGTVAVYKLEKV